MPFADVDGARLHYLDVGTGELPVVLLHAFPLHSEMWAPQVACLAAGYRVVAPDLKGFGRSSAPEDASAYTMAAYAAEVAALLDALELDQVVLGGLSMGGYVAFSFLAGHMERVRALVLADTRAGRDSPEVMQRRTDQQEQVRREGTAALVDTQITSLLTPATREGRPELVEHVRAIMASNPPAGVIGALEAMKGRPDATDHLGAIAVPTLVLVGEHDGPSPPELVREWQERIPGSRLAVVPGAGHLSNLESPDAFNAEVSEFLESL